MVVGSRSGMGLASMILIAGSIVLLFFVVLSGVKNTSPLKETWFLQADTSSFSGAGRSLSQWTYFYVCGAHNKDCGKPVPDLPVGYAWVGGTGGVPAELVGKHAKHTTSTYYYYMWRFGWVFYLIALIFDVLAFFSSLLAPFSRLASGLSGTILMFALFWMTLAASLMTVTFVKMRNVFRHNGISADVGKYAFGFTWGAWAAMLIATVLLFLGCGLGGRKDHVTTSSGGMFRRNRSKRSARGGRGSRRGSFIDNESGRRVKEEY